MGNKKLIVIAGPTASGKTRYAIELALYLHTEIISADSRQLYKEINIGTAKPGKHELSQVPHHFINTLSIFDEYTAGDFEKDALKKIEEIHHKNEYVIMAGGSGLFIDAVTKGFDVMPPKNNNIREQLNHAWQEKGIQYLQEELKIKDPAYFKNADLNNPKRLIRALEVIRSTGYPYSAYRKQHTVKRPFETIKIALCPERTTLYQKINERVDNMIRQGLYEEAKSLYPYKKCNALQTVGYSEIFDYLAGKYNWEDTVALIKRNTRRYAKRQITWLRKDNTYTWIDPEKLHNFDFYTFLGNS